VNRNVENDGKGWSKSNDTGQRAVLGGDGGNADVAATAQAPPAPRRGRRTRRDVTAADASGMKDFERRLPLREPVRGEHDKQAVLQLTLKADRLPILILLSPPVFFVVEKSRPPPWCVA
jgi:hypothetical protein